MKILVIGAAGMLGQSVYESLVAAGHEVSALVHRTPPRDVMGPTLPGSVFVRSSLVRAMQGQDAVYLNLSVGRTEKKSAQHAEDEGVRNILAAAKESGVGKLGYLSSLIQDCPSPWWVFQVKRDAEKRVLDAPLDSFVFKASTFMETLRGLYSSGPLLLRIGRPTVPFHWVCGSDLGGYVDRCFRSIKESHQFVFQGSKATSLMDAFRLVQQVSRRRRWILRVPASAVSLGRLVSREARYGHQITRALNQCPEPLLAQDTWGMLGVPPTTLSSYVRASFA